MKIVDYIEHYAAVQPEQRFVIAPDGESVTYGAFWQRVVSEAETKTAAGLKGTAVVCRAQASIDYLVQYFACQRAGAIIVPLEKDIALQAEADIVRRLQGISFPAEASDILFTSGTTGAPKGVMLSHRALLTDAENLVAAHGYHTGLTFIINGPLNHFGSHSKVLAAVRSGATLYLMDGMKSLEDFYQAMERIEGKVATFLVPASLRMLMQLSAQRLASYADRIAFIETGAAPISQSDMQQLSSLLPQSHLFNTYAGSEVGVVCTYDFNDGLSLPACVGRPFPYSQIEIRDGVIVCKGDGLMMGYLGQPEPYQETLPEVVTSDLGQVDAEGRLILTGRQGDLINVGGLKVSPVEVEEVAVAVMPEIKDCICVAQPHPLMGYVPKLLVVMREGATLDKRSLAKALKSRLESYKVPVNILEVETIQRTYNGKLDRKFYHVTQ